MESWIGNLLTGEERADFEPAEASDQFLNDLMKKRSKNHRNFITSVTATDRDDRKYRVRVNCKYSPKETSVPHHPNMMYLCENHCGQISKRTGVEGV